MDENLHSKVEKLADEKYNGNKSAVMILALEAFIEDAYSENDQLKKLEKDVHQLHAEVDELKNELLLLRKSVLKLLSED